MKCKYSQKLFLLVWEPQMAVITSGEARRTIRGICLVIESRSNVKGSWKESLSMCCVIVTAHEKLSEFTTFHISITLSI